MPSTKNAASSLSDLENGSLFAGSERGGECVAFMYTLIGAANINDVDPQAWLANVFARIADMPQCRLRELLPWNWLRPVALAEAA